MKASVTVPMAAHLAQEVTTLAYLWKVTRNDGQVFGFTNHDTPIALDGVTYEATSGFTPTAVSTTSGLSVDDVELEGVLSSEAITQADILAGLWDRAEVWLYQVNYRNLADGAIVLRRGWTGEIRAGKNSFVTELRGVNQRLNQQIGQSYSPTCRANFGDPRCGKDLADFKVTGSVTAVTDRRIFSDASRTEADGTFEMGFLRFTSGNNSQLSREIKTYATDTISCEIPFPFDVRAGDTYEMFQGCNKTLVTCKTRFNNLINFRGEPYIPVTDFLTKGPD